LESCPCVCKARLLQNWSLQMSTRSPKPFLRSGDPHLNLKLLSSMIVFLSSFFVSLIFKFSLSSSHLDATSSFLQYSLWPLLSPNFAPHTLSNAIQPCSLKLQHPSSYLFHAHLQHKSSLKPHMNHTWGSQEANN
jgi:hypothetical protein